MQTGDPGKQLVSDPSMYAPPFISTPRFTAVLIAAENAVAVDSFMPHE